MIKNIIGVFLILLFGLLSGCAQGNYQIEPEFTSTLQVNAENNAINSSLIEDTKITSQITSDNVTVQEKSIENTPSVDAEDFTEYPFIKFASSGEAVAKVDKLAKDIFITNVVISDFICTDKNEIALALKRAKKENTDPIDIGNFTLYNTDYGPFISEQGQPMGKAIACISIGRSLFDYNLFTNKNGDLFFDRDSVIYHIYSDTKKIDCFGLSSYHWFSNNNRYVSNYNERTETYNIIDLDTMDVSLFDIPNVHLTNDYDPNNFIIGDNGELVICDSTDNGVGDIWENNDKFYNVFITGIKANNVYKANFQAIPLYVSSQYLLYTDKMQLNKISALGTEVLLKYVDFEKPYFYIWLEQIPDSPYDYLKSRSKECIFYEYGGKMSNNTPGYSFNYANATLSKVIYDENSNKFRKH